MTTLYVDYNTGNDTTGDGSQSTPYKTYAKAYTILGGNGNHTIYLKRGTIEPIASSLSMRSGSSATARSTLDAWGTGENPILQASATNSYGVMWHLDDSAYKTIKNITFDANKLAKFAGQIYNYTSEITDIVHENCVFKTTSNVSAGDALNIQSDAGGYVLISGIIFRNCKFYNASRHGAYVNGNCNVLYEDCEAYNAGLYDTGGGHGFSSFAAVVTSVTSGWTNTSGTIYSRSATGVFNVIKTTATALALKKNTATPTTPASGEWGENSGTLYINIGADPAGVTIKYSTYAPTVRYERCTSHHNYSVDGIEGSGFQADDHTASFTANRCIAYSNGGPGFFLNVTNNAVLTNCVAYNNDNFGIAGQGVAGVSVINCTSINNCLANRSGYDGDMKWQIGCQNVTVKNTVVKKGTSSVATASIRFSSDSETGATLTDVVVFGAAISATGTVTQTRVQTVNPLISDIGYIASSSSPLIHTGSFIKYSSDLAGVTWYNPPSMGAYEYVNVRGTR